MRRQIKKQMRVFVALLFLLVGSLGIAGYILSNQRFYLPAWVPVIGTDFYEVKAELPTAQAVVPGQGQTVNIAGVKVGEVGEVKLEDGHAVAPDEPLVLARKPKTEATVSLPISGAKKPRRSTYTTVISARRVLSASSVSPDMIKSLIFGDRNRVSLE